MLVIENKPPDTLPRKMDITGGHLALYGVRQRGNCEKKTEKQAG